MEEERNTEGWSARQLIKQLKDSTGNRQQAVGSRQFEAPTKEENQSRTRSVGTVVGHSSVGSKLNDGKSSEGQSGTGTPTRPKTSGKKSQGGIFRGLISGTLISESLILKDMKYSALIAVLAIIFIANKFNAERVEREIIVLEQEVRDMRAEALSVSAELGSVSRQSEITDLVKERGLGLEELREPPYRIVVNK